MVSLKKVWTMTYDASYQHVRKMNSSTFELIEMGLRNPIFNTFEVYTDRVCLDDYSVKEQLECVSGFGYKSLEDLKNEYDNSAPQIIAKCIFEHYGSFAVEPIFVGTEQECRCKICQHVKGDLCHDQEPVFTVDLARYVSERFLQQLQRRRWKFRNPYSGGGSC